MKLVYPGMVRLRLDSYGHVDVAHTSEFDTNQFDTTEQALDWLDAELPTLQAAAIHAAAQGNTPRYAWQLADQLRGYFLLRRNTLAWLTTGETGLAAAQQAGDIQAQAAMHQSLGQAAWSAGQHQKAVIHYRQARQLAEQAQWNIAVAYAHRGIGQVETDLGLLKQAEASYAEGMRISKLHGFEYVQAVILNDVGSLCHYQGALIQALDCFRESLRINKRLGHHTSAGLNRHNIAMILRQQGQFAAAREHLHEQLANDRARRSPIHTLATLDELSQLHTQVAEHDDALSTAREALQLARQCADPRAEAAVLDTLAEALAAAGATADARQHFQAALTIAAQRSYPSYVIRAQSACHMPTTTTACSPQPNKVQCRPWRVHVATH